MKINKFLIVRIHDEIIPIPNFGARPKNTPIVPNVCELDQLLNEIFQKNNKQNAFLFNYRLKLAKNGEI